MEIPSVERLKKYEKPPIRAAVMITPTSWVQLMETPPREIGVWGRNRGKEKFSVPKGVR